MCLVLIKRTIRVELVFEDPFANDDVGERRSGNECPGVVGDQGPELVLQASRK